MTASQLYRTQQKTRKARRRPTMTFSIITMTAEDWLQVRDIYEDGIATGQATFETAAPDWASWDASHRDDCRLVAVSGDQVLGFVALSPTSRRAVYRGVAEVSIYIASRARGQGIGKALLVALVEASEEAGIWTLQAGIFPENKASVALHECCGFHVIGRRQKLGQLQGVWRDILLLERRSTVIGE